MTDQERNSLRYKESGYDLLSANPGLFSPWDHGIEPQDVSSSNWSGYLAGFEVVSHRLYLVSLYVGYSPKPRGWTSEMKENDPLADLWGFGSVAPLPPLNGATAEDVGGGYWLYRDIGLALDYTGKLVLGEVHQKLDGTEDVVGLELEFRSGVVTNEQRLSSLHEDNEL
ncbi:hypothetical protein [Marinobacter lipolyticus]|uniref:hypothetical protein n=1 Tax=Marinobacter lipolyticus TaxID=209639 RepID=UPI003A8CD28F